MQRIAAVILAAACLLAAASPAAAFGLGSWVTARATYYGRDAWPLHTGSCEFGFICPNRWSDEMAEGYDVCAVSDKSDLYGHCGECLEVKCREEKSLQTGTAGEAPLDRSGMCANDKSVKVKIVDTCPCNYPNNAASNARWCCGDMPHLDLSQWVLEKLVTDIGKGVFGISYRTVDCKAAISNEAPTPPLAEQEEKDPHSGYKGDTDCGALETGSDGSQARVAKSSLSTESTTQQRAIAAPKPKSAPKPAPKPARKAGPSRPASEHQHFNLGAITQKKDPRRKKMAVAWWGRRQQQYRREGAIDRSGLPQDGSSAGYWSVWWRETFPTFNEGKKKTMYMKIWEKIKEGKLSLSKNGIPGN